MAALALPLRLITFNVRYDALPQDRLPGEEAWSTRFPAIIPHLNFLTAPSPSAFLCLQEVHPVPYADLKAHFAGEGSGWACVGDGRIDGPDDAGEAVPIFYRPREWTCERTQTYWVSETPEKASRGWDAACNRIVTAGRFRRNDGTGQIIVVMNTHLDHMGEEARRKGSEFLLKISKEWLAEGEGADKPAAVFVAGDFNCTPEQVPYQVLTSGLEDISKRATKERRYGFKKNTCTGEKCWAAPHVADADDMTLIDFVMVAEQDDKKDIEVMSFAVLPAAFDDGMLVSDHRPVVVDMQIPL